MGRHRELAHVTRIHGNAAKLLRRHPNHALQSRNNEAKRCSYERERVKWDIRIQSTRSRSWLQETRNVHSVSRQESSPIRRESIAGCEPATSFQSSAAAVCLSKRTRNIAS